MSTTPATIRAAIHAALPAPRIDWPTSARCIVYGGSDDESSHYAARLTDTGLVDAGKEGYEYARQLGQVQHVYALKMGPVAVRVVGPFRSPAGQFSNLRALERRVRF